MKSQEIRIDIFKSLLEGSQPKRKCHRKVVSDPSSTVPSIPSSQGQGADSNGQVEMAIGVKGLSGLRVQ